MFSVSPQSGSPKNIRLITPAPPPSDVPRQPGMCVGYLIINFHIIVLWMFNHLKFHDLIFTIFPAPNSPRGSQPNGVTVDPHRPGSPAQNVPSPRKPPVNALDSPVSPRSGSPQPRIAQVCNNFISLSTQIATPTPCLI